MCLIGAVLVLSLWVVTVFEGLLQLLGPVPEGAVFLGEQVSVVGFDVEQFRLGFKFLVELAHNSLLVHYADDVGQLVFRAAQLLHLALRVFLEGFIWQPIRPVCLWDLIGFYECALRFDGGQSIIGVRINHSAFAARVYKV